jgi:mono/diheme cytochrome c family protein
MKRLFIAIGVTGAGLLAFALQGSGPASAETDAQIERGHYLVHSVAMCSQCHSPRDERFNLLEERLLQGGIIPLEGPRDGQTWARRAPNLAGLAGFGPDEVKELLMTGVVPRTGRPPQAPMPPFLLNEEDADAVVAYLTSLRRAPH